MPLKKGWSRSSIAKNIAMELRSGRSRLQAIAIALSQARRAAKKAGKPEKATKKRRSQSRSERLKRVSRKLVERSSQR